MSCLLLLIFCLKFRVQLTDCERHAIQPFVQDQKRWIPILVNSNQVPLHISISSLRAALSRRAWQFAYTRLSSSISRFKREIAISCSENPQCFSMKVHVGMYVSRWKPFSRCARENSASRVTYQPQSDMIPRTLGMWYIIYRMPQILFLLMADAWGGWMVEVRRMRNSHFSMKE